MLTLPYPTSPNNGDPLDASIVQANQQAITQAIQTFDASQIQAGTLAKDASFAAALSPVTRLKETTSNFVQSGCTWSSVSGLQGTMTGGVVYINGLRVVVTGVVSYTFTASQDTYVDVDYNGNVSYVAVANNATSGMTLTANSIRVAKIVSNTSTLTIYQLTAAAASSNTFSGFDPLANPVYPTSPNRRTVGLQILKGQSINNGTTNGSWVGLNLIPNGTPFISDGRTPIQLEMSITETYVDGGMIGQYANFGLTLGTPSAGGSNIIGMIDIGFPSSGDTDAPIYLKTAPFVYPSGLNTVYASLYTPSGVSTGTIYVSTDHGTPGYAFVRAFIGE